MEEFEVKFININQEEVVKKLLALGGKKIGEYHYKRVIFDYPDFRLDKQGAWLRLRDEGERTTLTFKQRIGNNLDSFDQNDDGMYEKEIVVSDFDATYEILVKVGLIQKMYQENKRLKYIVEGIECDIDSWPLLNPYLEIEGKNWEEVYDLAGRLGFKKEEAKICSTNRIYRLEGLDDRNYTKLTFSEQIERKENKF